MKYKGTGMYPDKETCELEVTVEMYSSETVWTFDIDDKSDYYASASIGMSTAEVTRLRDQLNFLIKHEREHREAKHNLTVLLRYSEQQMKKHGVDFFDCPTKDLEDGDLMIPTLQEKQDDE